VDVHNAYRENYFSIVGLVPNVDSGREQIVRKPQFVACVVIRETLSNPAKPALMGILDHVQPDRKEMTIYF